MRAIHLLLAVVVLCVGTLACHAAINRYSLWLTAHPQAIVADSHSSATISAEVRDSNGKAVPDGTVVEFTTSLGIIERRARTTAGVARVRLESGTTTGTAVVSAVAADGSAVAEMRVDFLEPGSQMFDESFISISSDKHLGYDPGLQVVDSAGGVRIYHRGLTIDAEAAQVDVRKNLLRATARMGGEHITIKRGEKEILASALYYDFNSMRGVILAPAEEGAVRMAFRGRDLFAESDPDLEKPVQFGFEPIAESKVFIRAKSILIRPGEVVKIKRANYYLDGDKILSVPLQVVPLRGGASTGTPQLFTYGTEGLRLDLPIYYSLTPSGTGAVRLKHSEPTGWGTYSDRAGWQVDVDHEYTLAGSTQGRFTLNRVTARDWGIRWNQRMELAGDSQLYSYLDFPSHRDLYGTIDYSRPLGEYTWSVNLRGNKLKDRDGGYFAGTYLQSRSKPLIGSAVSYAFSTRFSYDNRLTDGSLGTGVGLQLYGKPLQFGPSTSVNTSLMLARDWGGSNAGTTAYANAGLYRMLGNIGQFGLNYSYSWTDSAYGYSAQRVSTNLLLRPSPRWGLSLYSIYGLNDGTVSAFGDINYEILPTWRLGLLGTYQKFQYANYTDAEVSLAKLIGRQQVMLTWSKSRQKFRLEFSPMAF